MRSAELGGRRLTQNDGARLAQRPYGGVVAFGKVTPEGFAAHLRGHVVGLKKILDADRHTIDRRERPPGLPACAAGVCCSSGASLVQDDEGFDDGLALADHLMASLQIGARRVGAVAKALSRIVKAEYLERAGVVAGRAPRHARNLHRWDAQSSSRRACTSSNPWIALACHWGRGCRPARL